MFHATEKKKKDKRESSVFEFARFARISSKCEKRAIEKTTTSAFLLLIRDRPPSPPRVFFLFFCESLLNRFLSKIYIFVYLYTFVSPPRVSLSFSLFLSLWPRLRSPTQRSSPTYGYSNDQGTLDGSNIESLGRRCPPSGSTVSIFHSSPAPPPRWSRRRRSRGIFLLTIAPGVSLAARANSLVLRASFSAPPR